MRVMRMGMSPCSVILGCGGVAQKKCPKAIVFGLVGGGGGLVSRRIFPVYIRF